MPDETSSKATSPTTQPKPSGLTPEEQRQTQVDIEHLNQGSQPGDEQPMRDIQEAHAEVQRELQVRRRCYGRWIDDGRMSRVDAVDRYARLQSALVYLQRAAETAGVKLNASEAGEQVPF